MQNPKVTQDRAFNEFGTNFEDCPEPIYGNLFLPRKFKVAVTVPGDNSVDVLTNDIGVVVICDSNGELQVRVVHCALPCIDRLFGEAVLLHVLP